MRNRYFAEIPLVFDCLGDDLVGVVHKPEAPAIVGVLAIVAGGPQYRAGVGRGMVSMARELAGNGVAVMRFDYRGLGDSAGTFLGYESIAEDIAAAVRAFRREVPDIQRVVLWGGCDAASAAMIHGWKVPGVFSLVLGNPWVSTAEIRSVVLRKHYLKRLGERFFWRKLLSSQYNLVDYARAGTQKIIASFKSLVLGLESSGGSHSAAKQTPLDKMLAGLIGFEGPVLFIMSGQSLVTHEFDELLSRDPAWRAAYGRPSCKRVDLPDADQTFSDKNSRERVNAAILDWVNELKRI